MASPDNFRFNLYYLQMPRFYESSSEETVDKSEASEKQSGDKDMKYWRIFLILVFCYYFISCGVERIYQVLVMIISVDNDDDCDDDDPAHGLHLRDLRPASSVPWCRRHH